MNSDLLFCFVLKRKHLAAYEVYENHRKRRKSNSHTKQGLSQEKFDDLLTENLFYGRRAGIQGFRWWYVSKCTIVHS